MFKAKLEDGTEIQVALEDLPNFFKEHGKGITTQRLDAGPKRTDYRQRLITSIKEQSAHCTWLGSEPDGNPSIWVICQPKNVSIRIIEEEVKGEELNLGFWIGDLYDSSDSIPELVISAELNYAAYLQIEELINNWLH